MYDDNDGYAAAIRLPSYEQAEVVVDPARSFGAPIFQRGAARVVDVLDQIWAGDPIQEVADDFRVPVAHVQEALSVGVLSS